MNFYTTGGTYPDEATVYRSPSYRGLRRSRPYGDPYNMQGEDDSVSDLSPWSVDENMHRLLYDGSVPTVSIQLSSKGRFTLRYCDCESDVANSWVLLGSIELFTYSNVIHQRKISRSLLQPLSVNGSSLRYAYTELCKKFSFFQNYVLCDATVITVVFRIQSFNCIIDCESIQRLV